MSAAFDPAMMDYMEPSTRNKSLPSRRMPDTPASNEGLLKLLEQYNSLVKGESKLNPRKQARLILKIEGFITSGVLKPVTEAVPIEVKASENIN